MVVPGDALNASRIATALCVPLTSTMRWATAPGNVRLTGRATGLARDSVANVSQVFTADRSLLTEKVGRVSAAQLDLVLAGIDIVLGR